MNSFGLQLPEEAEIAMFAKVCVVRSYHITSDSIITPITRNPFLPNQRYRTNQVHLALSFDVDHNGTLDYKEFVAHFVEGEYLDLGFSAVASRDERQMAASQRMSHTAETMGKKLKERFMQITSQTTTQMFMDTFLRLDELKTGKVDREMFAKGMTELNLTFSDTELDYIYCCYDPQEQGLCYSHFGHDFCPSFHDSVMDPKRNPLTRHFVE
eukprot:354352-Prorocentrum_minimum.AAC.4